MWLPVVFTLPPSPKSQLPPVRRLTDLSFFAALARATLAQGFAPPPINAPTGENTQTNAVTSPASTLPATSHTLPIGGSASPPVSTPLSLILPGTVNKTSATGAQSAPPPAPTTVNQTPTAPPPAILNPTPPISVPTVPDLSSTLPSLASQIVSVATNAIPPIQLPVSIAPTPVPPAVTPTPETVAPTTVATSASAGSTNGTTWTLGDYPRPVGDTGRGFDWIPTLQSDPSTVDHYVSEAKKMGASWVVILNDNTHVGNNDYLVQQLVANHIEPVIRIYTSNGHPITGDLTSMVQHYVNLGVHYFVPYNEPNLPEENPDNLVSVSGYVDRWIPAARAIVAGGGLPGLGGLAPGAPVDDVGFLRSAIGQIQARGATDLLNHGWIAMHNYTFNRPINYQSDSNGFLKFRWYDQVAQSTLGRSLPIIGTEGGPRIGDQLDRSYPAVDQARRDQLVQDAMAYLPKREPYLFANTIWVLANQAGGGHDPRWNADALFGPGGTPTPLAQQLQSQTEAT